MIPTLAPHAVGACPRPARALELGVGTGSTAKLELADAQGLAYPDESFDTVVGTFVFCSIPDPHAALAEAQPVLRPGGQLLLLEHVLSRKPILRTLMRWLDPVPYWIWGAHINRDTLATVEAGELCEVWGVPRSRDFVMQISARRREEGGAR